MKKIKLIVKVMVDPKKLSLLFLFINLLFIPMSHSESVKPNTIKIVFLGDSLTEGYGIEKSLAFPSLVENLAKRDSHLLQVTNAGISGSTSASAESRAKWFVKSKPDILFLALGANDGLRGLSIQKMKENLTKTVSLLKKNNIKVFLVGMQMPPNYGNKYALEFKNSFQVIAKEQGVAFLPFLLDGVAGQSELNQPDGLHPNEKGHEVIAKNVYSFLKPFLTKKNMKGNNAQQ